MQSKDSKGRSAASKTGTGSSMNETIVKHGYLKKQKTMKKKYFVLYGESPQAPARLEYYDSEKRFKANQPPKRSIILKNCFNINKQSTGRQKYVIALYTRIDHFSIVFETEDEMELWLKLLLQLQMGEDIPEGTPIRPNFEHVWHVRVLEKALGAKNGIFGSHFLCLTDRVISLVKMKADGSNDAINFSLHKIRRCGNVDTFFYLEVGQCTVTGAGHLWMEAEDQNIAENMHLTILKYCYILNPNVKNMKMLGNNISCSPTSESSKSASILQYPTLPESGVVTVKGEEEFWSQRAQAHPLSPDVPTRRASTGTRPTKIVSSPPQMSSASGVRDRSDSMPTRPRTTSESLLSHPPRPYKHSSACNAPVNVPSPSRFRQVHTERQTDEVQYSPPSVGCSTDSAGSSLSIEGDTVDGHWDDSNRLGHPITPDGEVILEENLDDYATWQVEDEQLNNYMHADMSYNLANHNAGSAIFRKNSPNPTTTSFKSASPGQGSYMEVYSPCGTSPAETTNYMPMSPAEHRTLTTVKPTINHSRGSSITEEGYVPMTPGNDGYVDMDHGSNRYKSDRYQSGELSTTESSCSIASGTPSTDHRFCEYPLDKVNSYFPADEEMNPAERPARAYSVGSRPNSFNPRTEIPAVAACERTRAFSVGSKSVKCGLNQLRVALSNSHALSSSHSSVEPSDDMMEMDFSKKGRMRYKKKMTSLERLSVPCGSASTISSTASSYSTAEGSYMEMSPRTSSPSLIPSPPKGSRFAAALSKSPPKHIAHEHIQDMQSMFKSSQPVTIGYPSPSLGRVPEGEPCYMEMTSSDSGELKATSSPSYVVNPPGAKDKHSYMEMKPSGLGEAKHVIVKNVRARIDSFPETVQPSKPYSSINSNKLSKEEAREAFFRRKLPLIEDNNNSEYLPSAKNVNPEEYVEMNLGSSAPFGKSPEETDYMNMSLNQARRESTRSTSKPITIQSNAKEVPEGPVYLIGRKQSTATPPKVPGYLPLSSSLSPSSNPLENRARARKNTERRNSKESAGSITTPIFPFSLNSPANSPGSYDSASKCPVDASSGTVRLSYADSASEEDLKTTICEDVRSEEDYLNYQPHALGGSTDHFMASLPATSSGAGRKSSAPVYGSKMRPFEKLLSGLGSSFSSLTLGSTPLPSTSRTESQIIERHDASTPTPEDERNTGREPGARKTSISSDKKLHYASLDLARSSSEQSDDSGRISFRAQSSLTESSSASSPSPNATIEASEFRYVEIDFSRSSRHNSSSSSSSCGNSRKSAPQ